MPEHRLALSPGFFDIGHDAEHLPSKSGQIGTVNAASFEDFVSEELRVSRTLPPRPPLFWFWLLEHCPV